MTDCPRRGPGWFVAQVEPGRSLIVSGRILAELRMDTYCPVERMRKVVRGRTVDTARPLIPGYVFVSFEPHRAEWAEIERVKGVIGLLRNNDIPSRIPTAWVEATRRAEAYGIFDRTKAAPIGFEVGDKVRIQDGPLSGHMAIIEEFTAKLRSTTARKRAKVMLTFMGRLATIELPIEALERI